MIDTDVLLSGVLSSTGASRIVLLAVFERIIVPLITVPMLVEYEAVLRRPDTLNASNYSERQVDDLLDGLARLAEQVHPRQQLRPSIRDPSDEMFVEAFVNGRADALVSFNRRDYLSADDRLASQGLMVVPVLRPGELLMRMRWRPSPNIPSAFPRP